MWRFRIQLSLEEQKIEFKKLYIMVEKVLVKESDNKIRAKMISNFLKSKLSEKIKKMILKKAMIKLDLSTEDRKEITLIYRDLRKRMDSKK